MSYESALATITQVQARLQSLQPALSPSIAAEAPEARGFAGTLGQALSAQATTAAAQTPGAGSGETAYDGMIVQAATEQGIDPALLKALVRAESGFNPNAVSSSGAQGLAQLMPATGRGLGVTDPFDPQQSLNAGARYLANALRQFGGDPSLALAAYNAGPGAVQRYGGIPPFAETQAYVPRVLSYMQQYKAEGLGQVQAAAAIAPASVAPVGPGGSAIATQALELAQAQMGTPYRWGGELPGGFDCSGLIQWAYGQKGVEVPRVAADQAKAGVAVPRDQLAPGDLIPFADSSGYVHHIGLYIGGDKFLHAPKTGDVVKVSSLSEPHYAREYAGARRVA
jgi:cell wall-associated NlpC family hydrolase